MRDKYGKAQVLNDGGEGDKALIWTNGDIIIHYLSGKENIGEESSCEKISARLTVVKKQALKNGLWPYSKGLLKFSNN